MNLSRRIWLTGASSGIGLELTRLLLAEGHCLALSARRAEPLLAFARRYPGGYWHCLATSPTANRYAPSARRSSRTGARWTA